MLQVHFHPFSTYSRRVLIALLEKNIPHEKVLSSIEMFGKYVIPEFDKDPVHSTTHYRRTAKPKFEPFNAPPPDIKTMYMG